MFATSGRCAAHWLWSASSTLQLTKLQKIGPQQQTFAGSGPIQNSSNVVVAQAQAVENLPINMLAMSCETAGGKKCVSFVRGPVACEPHCRPRSISTSDQAAGCMRVGEVAISGARPGPMGKRHGSAAGALPQLAAAGQGGRCRRTPLAELD
jgi:hypothetical protein